jgi:DNA invertase Pin-like site-specific DNA recombinase
VQDVKVAIYARYSSDNQRDASIADQLRVCRAFAERQDWSICEEYTDHAVSGATLLRAGFQALMRDALNHRFDVVLAEALDRFSRDQEDTAGLFKRLTFAGVNIVTLAEGDITHLHIGFKGTMNALFLKDLAEKTHRGLRGRIEDGKSAGGLCYGYRVVRAPNAGTVTTGEREIDPQQAAVVERIFRDFVAGVSPKQIAKNLNRDGVAGPCGGAWSPSTIYGNGKRGTGILNNELYIGRLVWNRLRYLKNPDTGKRVSRLNPEAEWMRKEVPHLCIVSDEMWAAAKQRQELGRHAVRTAGNPVGARRPQYLFSGLTKCGICGAGFIMTGKHRLGCFGARDQGRCDNHLTVRRDEVEARVLKALQEKLLNQELFAEFCYEFTREMNRLRMERRASLSSAKRDVERIGTRIKKLLNLMLDDEVAVDEGKAEMKALDARRKELQAQLDTADAPPTLLHPEMSELYRQKVTTLAHALEAAETRTEAREALRGLIDAITLIPEEGVLRIELKGNLAAMLGATVQSKRSPQTGDLSLQVSMVAGARSRQYRLNSTWWPRDRQHPSPRPWVRRDVRSPVPGVLRTSPPAILHAVQPLSMSTANR